MVVLLVGGAAGENRGSGAGSRFPPTPLQLFTMTVHLDDISFLKLLRTQDGPKDQNILGGLTCAGSFEGMLVKFSSACLNFDFLNLNKLKKGRIFCKC